MNIDINIESYNPFVAFGILLAENENIKETSFIDLTGKIPKGKSIEDYKGLGLLFCIETKPLGENPNQIQFKIENNIQKGTKDFSTEYVLITDYKTSGKATIINGKLTYEIKSDAEDAAKKWVSENKRDLHIKMVKVCKNADPISTSILYKMSPKQQCANYRFFN